MSSPSNRQHRRTAPYVVMNNHTQPPSVAYTARAPDQNSKLHPENGIENLTRTPLRSPEQEEIDVTTSSFFKLVRRAQVRGFFCFENVLNHSTLSDIIKCRRCK